MMNTTDSMPTLAPDVARVSGAGGNRTLTISWHRLTLGAIVVFSGFLNFWNLGRLGYGNTFYAAAVRSMMESWHNFFFNSFDPGGFVTIDKPPLGFWFQVIAAKIFGFNGFSLILPSALAGMLSVLLLYHLVGRVFGHAAGLLAALAMAVTPVAVATNRSNIIDSILVLFMLAAAWAAALAAERSSLRLLLLSGVLAGLAFNVKMLEAYLVVPALGVVYLVGSRGVWWKRLVHLGLAVVVLLVVSLSWALAVDLTPPSDRPFVDSTTTNSELDLATGYNGLERLTGQNRFGGLGGRGGARPGDFDIDRFRRDNPVGTGSGSANNGRTGIAAGQTGNGFGAGQPQTGFGTSQTQPGTGTTTGGAGRNGSSGQFNGAPIPGQGTTGAGENTFGANGGRGRFGQGGFGDFPTSRSSGRTGGRPGGGGGAGMFDNGSAGPLRLFGESLGGQAGWLLAFALIGLSAAATTRRVTWRLDRQQQAVVLWGMWLITAAGFFSVAGFFHSYYLVTLAPPIAALTGIGAVTLWRDYRRPGWRFVLLPIALVVAALTQRNLLQPYSYWNGWLSPTTMTLTIAAAVVLLAARLRVGKTRRLRRALRLWTPLAASVGVIALLIAPSAWSLATMADGGGGATPTAGPTFGGFGGGGFGGGGVNVNSGLLTYLEKEQGTTKYLLAVQNSNSAAPYIIETGKPVMSLGGFGGSDPIVTLPQLQELVSNNTVRFFMGVGGFGGNSGIGSWVESACKLVPTSDYETVNNQAFAYGGQGAGIPGGGAPTAGQAGQGVGQTGVGGRTPAQAGELGGAGGFGGGAGGFGGGAGGFGGGFGGGQGLYDCAGAVS